MTCRGYDPKAVNLPKSIRRFAGYEMNAHKRGAILASFTKIYESELRSNKRSAKDSK